MFPAHEPSGLLPPGEHEATWPEFVQRFGITPQRRLQLEGLLRALQALRAAGCRRVWIDGSFVTTKPHPGDWDGCWDPAGVVVARLDPVLTDFRDGRRAQKATFRGELFDAEDAADRFGTPYRDFFQGRPHGPVKGVVVIDLVHGGLP